MQPEAPGRSVGARSAIQAGIILVAFLAVGAVSGLVWHLVWDAPTGVVSEGAWQITSEDGYRAFFSATGWFVVLSAGFGLGLGLLTGLLTRQREVVSLISLIVASVLAAVVMWQVGLSLSNPDPTQIARGAVDGTMVKGRIAVGSWSPFLAYPTAAIFGLLVPFLVVAGREEPASSPMIPGVADSLSANPYQT